MADEDDRDGGVIMEISGLGQLPQIEPIPEPSHIALMDGGSSWTDYILPIGIPIAIAFLIKVLLVSKKEGRLSGDDCQGLGILKKCRVVDRVQERPARDQEWCLWDSKGKRILGRHPSRSRGLRQEHLIQLKKRGR